MLQWTTRPWHNRYNSHIFGYRAALPCEHRWFSGRMLACHAGGPGSIPGRCTIPFSFQDIIGSRSLQCDSGNSYIPHACGHCGYGLGLRSPTPPPPPRVISFGQKSFQIIGFCLNLRDWCPLPSGKSWIRHWWLLNLQWRIQDFPGGGGGANLLFGIIFPKKTCMKMRKKLDWWRREGSAPPRSATDLCWILGLIHNMNIASKFLLSPHEWRNFPCSETFAENF